MQKSALDFGQVAYKYAMSNDKARQRGMHEPQTKFRISLHIFLSLKC